MRLKFMGGVQVVSKDGQRVEEEREELTQLFEETEYHWPAVGTVLQVSDEIGGWLQAKLGKLIERVPDTEHDKPKGAPRRQVASAPEKPKQAAAAAK